MVDYAKTISGGLKFAIDPKRWLPFFALDAVCFTVVFAYLVNNIYSFTSLMSVKSFDFTFMSSLLGIFAVFAAVFVVWSLVRLYITGAMIHQSVKPKEIRKSCTVSKERYLSLLVVAIVVGAATSIAGFVPYVGWVLSIIVGLIFFFSMPPVVINRTKFDDALSESYRLFREKTVDVFIAWLLIAIVSSLVVLVFMIPAISIAFATLMPYIVTLSETSAAGMGATGFLSAVLSNGWMFFAAGVVFLIGSSISTTFSIYSQAHFYLQLKKKSII